MKTYRVFAHVHRPSEYDDISYFEVLAESREQAEAAVKDSVEVEEMTSFSPISILYLGFEGAGPFTIQHINTTPDGSQVYKRIR